MEDIAKLPGACNSYEIQTLQSPEDISSFFWGSQRELEFYIPKRMKLKQFSDLAQIGQIHWIKN